MNRRRLLALATAILIAAIAVVALRPVARRLLADRALRDFAAGASAGLGAPVAAGSARIAAFNPIVIVYRDVAMRGRSTVLPLTRATADRLTVSASPRALLFWGRHPVEFLAEGPRFTVDFDAIRTGPGSAGSPAAGAAADARAALPPGSSVRGRGGELLLLGFGAGLACDPMSLDAGPGDGAPVAGRLSCGGGTITVPGARFEPIEGQARFTWSPAALRLDPLLVHAAGIDLSARATVGFPGATPIDADGGVDLELTALAPLLPAEAAPAGHATVKFTGRVAPWPGALTGTFRAAPIRLYGVEAGNASGRFAWDGRLRAEDVGIDALGGTLQGGGVLTPVEGGATAEGNVTAVDLDAARLLAIAGWAGPAIGGKVRYEGRHSIGAAGIATLRGGGRLGLDGTVAVPGRPARPLTVGVTLDTRGRTVLLSDGRMETATVSASFDGRFEPATGLALHLRGGSGALSDLLPLFAPPPRSAADAAGMSIAVREAAARRLLPARFAPPARLAFAPATLPARRSSWHGRGDRAGGPPAPAAIRAVAWGGAAPAARAASGVAAGAWRAVRSPRATASALAAAWSARAAAWSARAAAWSAPAAAAAASAARSPIEVISEALGGRWEWDGDLRMDRQGVRYAGVARGRGLAWRGTPIGDLDADIRVAGGRLTIDRLDLVLAGGGRAAMAGTITFDRDGALDLRGTLEGVPAELIAALLGRSLPIQGAISGPAEARGTFAAPEGRLVLAPAPFTIGGVAFDRIGGTVELDDGVLRGRLLEARLGDGSVRLDGGLRVRPGGGSPNLDIVATGIDLKRLAPLLTLTDLIGTLDGGGRLEGDLLAPGGHLALVGRSMSWRGLKGGDLTLDVALAPDATGTGSSARVRLTAPARSLTVEGTVGVGGDWPIDLDLLASDLTLRGAEIVEGIPEEVTVWAGGRGKVSGPARRPRELGGRFTLDTAGLAVGAASARTEAPVEAILEAGRLEIQPAVLSGTGTRVEFRGGADLDPLGTVAVEASGQFDLALLRTFVRGLQAEGTGRVGLSVSGLRRDPAFRGTLTMQAPRLRYLDLPSPIDDLDARIAFDGSIAGIESLTFRAGGGEVVGSGEALIGKSGVTRGLAAVLAADVTLRGRNVRAEFPDGFRSLSDFELRLIFDPTGLELRGAVDFVRGVYERDFRIESAILRGQKVSLFDMGEAPTGPLGEMRLDLALRAPEQLWLRNDFGRIEGQADLEVTGTAGAPSVTGRITALEGSTIDFNRVRYQVLSGTIDFNDPEVIDPYFNLNAETTISDYTVTLRVEGTIESLRYDLTSNPPLPTADIVALLITGSPPSVLGNGSSIFSPDSVSAYLAGQFTQQMSSRFLGRVAPDIISIDPLADVTQTDPSTRITVGKQVTPDLRVVYSDNLGGEAGASYQVDYSVARNVQLSSLRDDDGSIGGDVRFIVPGKPPIVPGVTVFGSEVIKPRIAGLTVEGEAVFPDERILRKLRLAPGKRRDRGKINDRLERLIASYRREGYLMAEVDVIETAASPGTVDLEVRANAGARVHLEIEGVGRKRDLLEAVEPIWRLSLFPEDTIENSRQVIESLLIDGGWRRATVTASRPEAPPGEMAARFSVDRGPRARADEVRIEGARQVEPEELARVLTTKPDTWLRRGIVRGERLREDAGALAAFLLARGYPRASVEEPRVDLDPTGEHAVVTFTVDEGPRVSVACLRFEGARVLPETTLNAAAALPLGGPFVRTAVDDAAGRIRKAYDDVGWPDARVRWSAMPIGAPDDLAEQDEIIFRIEEGTGQIVGPIDLGGNAITDDTTILRALRVDPYQPLSRADLLAGQTRLYRLGIFRSVDLRPEPRPEEEEPTPRASRVTAPPERDAGSGGTTATDAAEAGDAATNAPAATDAPAETDAPDVPAATDAPAETDVPDATDAPEASDAPTDLPAATAAPAGTEPGLPAPEERPVRTQVVEASPIRQVYGIGYDSEERIRGLYEIAHRNLFGTARYLGLQLRGSAIEAAASILYREQGVFGGRYDLLGSAFGIDEERPAFTGRTVGVAAQLSREVGRATRLQYRYALRDVNLSESTVDFTGQTLRLANLAGAGVHDTRDSPFSPTRGHYYALELQGYGEAIGSDAQFAKAFAQTYTFRTVGRRAVWAQAVRAGIAPTFGRSRDEPETTGDAVSGLPQSERFFAGGDTTLRGFRRDRVGPLDEEGDPIGGEGLFILNEELRFPVWRALHGVVFAETGNVYRTVSDFTLRDLRLSAGIGLRLATPIGPFRAEYGWVLDRRPDEAPGTFYISIGEAF